MRNTVVLAFLLLFQAFLQGQPKQVPHVIHVGVVLDAPSGRNAAILREFELQLTGFFVPQHDVRFLPEFTVTADGTVQGIRKAIDKLMTNPEIEIVLALGGVSSHEIATRPVLPKPSIATYVIDAELQSLPAKNGASGVRNLNYLSAAYSAKRTIDVFRGIVSFTTLAILIDPLSLEGIPGLASRVTTELKSTGIDVVWVPTTSAQGALSHIPLSANAVYVAPLGNLSSDEFQTLIGGLRDRKLPSFSYLGKSEVELGLLASYAPGDDMTRRARRVAINMQRILNGEDAGSLPVDFSSPSQLTLNMATARAIGFHPDWTTMASAQLLHEEEEQSVRTLSLAETVREAVRTNLSLAAVRKQVESGRQEVNKSRAPLLPQLTGTTTASLVRKETAEASFGLQPERQLQSELVLQQSVYSDRSWANYTIEGHRQEARESDGHRQELDIAHGASTAYLNLLRARTLWEIQRANLKLTISNLELARQREAVGASGKSDVYRWESEAATSRRNVIDADAQVQNARMQVNSILNRPLEENFATQEITIDDPSLITADKHLEKYFSNARTFSLFRDFMVQEGTAASPEIARIDAAIAAQERARTSAQRSFWRPDIGVQASLRNTFAKSGAGSSGPSFPPSVPLTLTPAPDLTWNVGLQLSLPIFQGGAKFAALEQSDIELERLAFERQAAKVSIEQRVRAALHTAGASHAGIQQARNASDAARKNLDLVTDAYSSGAASIITLIDAQNAALVAGEAAENAVYDFIIDLMNVERAIGTFDFFRSREEMGAFFQRLDAFYRAAGVSVE